jgi:membrane-bound serine protease (ClpP class)
MKRILVIALVLVGSAVWIAPSSEGGADSVIAIEIRGVINPASVSHLKSAIDRAKALGAGAVLVELDTPGGLLTSTREMAQMIETSPVPVLFFVGPGGASATSAGALLMLASHVSGMAPGTNIGAAHPVGSQGEDVKGAMGDKVLNDTVAFARSLSELRKRNVALSEEIVSKSKSLAYEEAHSQKLVDEIASDAREFLRKVHGRHVQVSGREVVLRTADVRVDSVAMTFGVKLLHWLAHPNIAGILLSLGLLLIYVEVSNPGITVAGALGGVCVLAALVSLQMLPLSVGAQALLILGVVLFAAEAAVSAHGALAFGGGVSLILGLLWLVDPSAADLQMSPWILAPIGAVTLGTTALVSYGAARTLWLNRSALAKMKGGGLGGLLGYVGKVESVSDGGLKGQMLVRGEIWNVVPESEQMRLRAGEWVEATGMEGFTVKVRAADPKLDTRGD